MMMVASLRWCILLLWHAKMACAFTPLHSYRIRSTDSSLTRHNVILPSMEIVDFGATNTLSFLNGLNDNILAMDQSAAEQLAGPFFGASLFPYHVQLQQYSYSQDIVQ